MNEKVNFLKFFVDTGRFSEDASLPEKLADFFPGLVFIYDAGREKLSYANEKFRNYFAKDFEHFLEADDHVIDRMVFESDLSVFNHEVARFNKMSENQSHVFTCRLRHQSEYFRYFQFTGTLLQRDINGKAGVILFVAQDVTDQTRREKFFEDRDELWSEIEWQLQFGCWTYDLHSKEVIWTDGMYRLLGYQRHEVEADTEFYLQHVAPEDRPGLQALFQRESNCVSDFEIEHSVTVKSGERKIVSVKGKLATDHTGAEKLVGVVRDITALKDFEREQERNLRELHRSNKELEEFAYVASHDLQEPLRKIAMFSERLKSRCHGALDKDAQLFMDRILASTDNMKVLIDNLLQFSRANRSSNDFASVDLNKTLEQVRTNFELKIEETKADIVIESMLPRIEAVGSEMEQLFSNLLSNAIKFRKVSEAPRITISSHFASADEKHALTLKKDLAYYIINVTDNGIGFEEQYAMKIFQIFQRLHGKTEYPGSGIGLAICKKIVENHNGRICAYSRPDEGATFTVILPEKQH